MGFAATRLEFIVMPLRGGDYLFSTARKGNKSALGFYQ
jgi:hypothetical protein